MSAETDSRRRLYALAKSLRQFGLVDEFGLAEAVSGEKLPTKSKIQSLLKSGRILLPSGVSAELLAQCINSALTDTESEYRPKSNSVLCTARQKLKKIRLGRQHAPQFHDLSMKLLEGIFDSHLGKLQKEKNLLQGLKRLDIKANNNKREGFFSNLRKHHSIHCPYIFCECKNYSEDPANPEFDQLLGRLNRTTTLVGLLICRAVKDEGPVLKRCREPYSREGKLVMVLTDKDMIQLCELRLGNVRAEIDEYLEYKLEEITL